MTRRRCRWVTLLIALMGLGMPLGEGHARPQPGLHEASIVSGMVQKVSAEQLVLIADQSRSAIHRAGGRMSFVLTPETQLRWGSQRIGAAELERGDVVTVMYHTQSGEKVAQAVWAVVAAKRELPFTDTAEAGAEAAYAQASRLIEAGHLRESLPTLAWALRLRPGFLAAYGRRGYVNATLATLEADQGTQRSYRQRALADYTNAINEGMKQGVTAAVWYNNRGVLYRQLQDVPHALEDFTTALQIEPTYLLALQNRAALRRDLGDADGAIADLTQVISLEPQIGQWYCQRGQLWLQRQATSQAHRDFERCQTLDPALREQYPETTKQFSHQPQG